MLAATTDGSAVSRRARRMTDSATTKDRVRTNYNETGVAVMQAMYSEGYLSIGGVESTDTLAALADLNASSHVLDIGCGVGGPALRLAESVGCRVVGLDLIESTVAQATATALDRGLGQLVSFEAGDATALPFADDSFDVVWGQDAWCHVPEKAKLVEEAWRVLRPGGIIAFTDWLAGSGMSGAERAAALDAAVSRDAATARHYLSSLDAQGFVDIAHTDISPACMAHYRHVYERLRTSKAELVECFGERVYAIVADINGTILHGFEGGAIEGGRFLARKPA